MADIKTVILSVLVGVAILAGFSQISSDYATQTGTTAANTGQFNSSRTYLYMETWNNQTARLLANAQAVPVFGGAFMLLTGAFQVITLMVGLPTNVVLPFVDEVTYAMGIPQWFMTFAKIAMLFVTLYAILRLIK